MIDEAHELPVPSVHAHPERFLTELADSFERIGRDGTAAGLRVLARLVVEDGRQIERLERELAALRGPGACPSCGGPIKQPTTGRRRRFCSDRCRRRAHRDETGTNGRIAS